MDDVTSSSSGKQSHESSMNQSSLRDNKSDVGTACFADLVQRRRLRLGCWNTGTSAGNIQREGSPFNYLLISRWGGKLRKKFQICRECSKAHNFDHSKTMAVIFAHCQVCQPNPGIKRSTSGAETINYCCAYRRPPPGDLVGVTTLTLNCINLAQKLTLGLNLAIVPAWKGCWDNIKKSRSLFGRV